MTIEDAAQSRAHQIATIDLRVPKSVNHVPEQV